MERDTADARFFVPPLFDLGALARSFFLPGRANDAAGIFHVAGSRRDDMPSRLGVGQGGLF